MQTTRFTLRQLDIFAAVMDTGQVRRAAQTLYLSQAAVSQALNELAESLDVTLFTRDGRTLKPTATAYQLAALSQSPRMALSNLAAQLHGQEATELAGPVRIAASTTIARYLLPRAIASLALSWPALQITLVSGNSANIEARIAEGQADIGLIEGPTTRDDMSAAAWRTDALTIIGSPDSPDVLDASALDRYVWVAREAGSGTRHVFEQSLALAGYTAPSPGLIIDDSGAQIRAIAAGAGLACVSEAAAHATLLTGQIKRVALPDVLMARPLWRIRRQNEAHTPFIERVVSHIDEQLDNTGRP